MLPIIHVYLFLLVICLMHFFGIQCQGLMGCSLKVTVDPFLTEHLKEKWTDKNYDKLGLKREINALVNAHVDFSNKILKKYSILPHGGALQLYLKRIEIIHFDDSCYLDANKAYCASADSLTSLLAAHSQFNHNDACLSYVLTFQHLHDDTLGLAWTANPHKTDEGGVCARNSLFDQIDSESQRALESHNTGVVNFAYNGKDLPDTVARLALVHELGHSLGSPHDYPPNCLGSRASGNYLMHSRGVTGYLENNYKLSPCSFRNISLALKALVKQDRDCFQRLPPGVCGNGIVESWEECDCGIDLVDCDPDDCCYPADHRQTPCQLKPKMDCSPSEGPCCTNDCNVIRESDQMECLGGNECRFPSVCDGTQAGCPPARLKSDAATCMGGTRICQNGKCAISVCARYNMMECGHNASITSPCEIHCQVPNRPHTCRSSGQLDTLFGSEAVYRPTGAPCDLPSEDGGSHLGTCSPQHECLGGHKSLSSRSWIVGLVIFLVCYLILTAVGLWIYCRYCKGGIYKRTSPNSNGGGRQLVLKSN